MVTDCYIWYPITIYADFLYCFGRGLASFCSSYICPCIQPAVLDSECTNRDIVFKWTISWTPVPASSSSLPLHRELYHSGRTPSPSFTRHIITQRKLSLQRLVRCNGECFCSSHYQIYWEFNSSGSCPCGILCRYRRVVTWHLTCHILLPGGVDTARMGYSNGVLDHDTIFIDGNNPTSDLCERQDPEYIHPGVAWSDATEGANLPAWLYGIRDIVLLFWVHYKSRVYVGILKTCCQVSVQDHVKCCQATTYIRQ